MGSPFLIQINLGLGSSLHECVNMSMMNLPYSPSAPELDLLVWISLIQILSQCFPPCSPPLRALLYWIPQFSSPLDPIICHNSSALTIPPCRDDFGSEWWELLLFSSPNSSKSPLWEFSGMSASLGFSRNWNKFLLISAASFLLSTLTFHLDGNPTLSHSWSSSTRIVVPWWGEHSLWCICALTNPHALDCSWVQPNEILNFSF